MIAGLDSALDDVNQAYADMRSGVNIRGLHSRGVMLRGLRQRGFQCAGVR